MHRRHAVSLGCFSLGLLLSACGGSEGLPAEQEESVASIEARLEQDNGGFTFDDESVFFAPEDINLPRGFDYDAGLLQDAQRLISEIPELPDGVLEDELPGDAPAADGSAPADPNAAGDGPGVEIAPPPCPHFLMVGRWKALKKGFGVFRGAYVNPKGEVVAFTKGIWGRHHFIGKTVGKNGKFMAILKGVYGGGHYKGRFITPEGVRGVVRGSVGPGHYRGLAVLLCAPMCKALCPATAAPAAGGNGLCACRAGCPADAHLDPCPLKIRVCKRLAVAGQAIATATNAAGLTKVIGAKAGAGAVTRCHLRCAPARCVPNTPASAVPDPA